MIPPPPWDGCEKIDDSRHFPIADVNVSMPPPPTPTTPHPLTPFRCWTFCGPMWANLVPANSFDTQHGDEGRGEKQNERKVYLPSQHF